MAKIPALDRPGSILPWWMTAIVTGQTTNARLPLSHLGSLPRGAILVSLANYVADTASTADADPGASNIRWNHATQASATQVFLSDVDGDSEDYAALWATLASGGHLYLYNPADLDVWQWWSISSVTDASGYVKLGVALTDSSGSFADDDAIVVTVQQPNSGSGGTPGGADTQVQFNDGGALGGDSAFTFNKVTKAVGVGGALNEFKGSNIASAGTTDIGAATGSLVHITGTTTITALGTIQAGTRRVVVFDGALTLTHNATSLILPTGANITTVAGDCAVLVSEGGGNWRCVSYQRANGQPLAGGGGGGLTNWTEGVNTSAPNNGTTSAAYLEAVAAAANADAVYKAKGNGASLAQIPDNTSAGGNKRGLYATDWQKQRSSAAQVASGQGAFVGAGLNNTASSTATVVVGGQSNTASNSYAAVVAGASNAATAAASFVGGGSNNVASGSDSCVPGGASNDADGQYSFAIGFKAQCRGIQGAVARSSGGFNNVDGDGQSRAFTLYAWTTNATQTTTTTDRGAAGTTNQVVLPNNSAFLVKGTINARKNATGDASAWEFTAYIKRGANAASTAMVVPCTPTLVGQDAGAAAWAVAVDADTTNGALRVRVTGGAGESIKWGVDIASCNEVVG